ncbi:hypothetical protein, partial [Bartonella sp. AA86SXKL]|uniref:hypothetical protein n=1 Tax=Bartonella sp. AA86SXKL TaxID=3243441 RepID=UPI0035CF781B
IYSDKYVDNNLVLPTNHTEAQKLYVHHPLVFVCKTTPHPCFAAFGVDLYKSHSIPFAATDR